MSLDDIVPTFEVGQIVYIPDTYYLRVATVLEKIVTVKLHADYNSTAYVCSYATGEKVLITDPCAIYKDVKLAVKQLVANVKQRHRLGDAI